MPISTTGCRMLGSWVEKPRRKGNRSETVRRKIGERSLKDADFSSGGTQ
jgi:hypothetical protein